VEDETQDSSYRCDCIEGYAPYEQSADSTESLDLLRTRTPQEQTEDKLDRAFDDINYFMYSKFYSCVLSTSAPTTVPSNAPTYTPSTTPTEATDAPTPEPFKSCEQLTASGQMMECSSFGDPHFTTFSGMKHNAMGQGEFVLMQSTDDSVFNVHVCHQPGDDPGVSVNTGVAISSKWGVLKFNQKHDAMRPPMPEGSGITLKPHTPSFGINTITFPSGEVVLTRNAGGVTQVNLPASYCDSVDGLCGAYSPQLDFTNALMIGHAVGDDEGTPFYASSDQVERFGGPYGGDFQSHFADSWKVGNAKDSEALFTDEECPSGPSYTGDPPVPFAACPELLDAAILQCPQGGLYEGCLGDVGLMCDLTKWVLEAKEMQAMERASLAPSMPPSLAPTSDPTTEEEGACFDLGVPDHLASAIGATCEETVANGHCFEYPHESGVYCSKSCTVDNGIPESLNHVLGPSCEHAASVGGCAAYTDEAKQYCARSCELCFQAQAHKSCHDYGIPPNLIPIEGDSCTDVAVNGACLAFPNEMGKYCAKTCAVDVGIPTHLASVIGDSCAVAAERGQCDVFPAEAEKYCSKTCNLCVVPSGTNHQSCADLDIPSFLTPVLGETCAETASLGACEEYALEAVHYCAATCTQDAGVPDILMHILGATCKEAVGSGACEVYPFESGEYCAKSCDLCPASGDTTDVATIAPSMPPSLAPTKDTTDVATIAPTGATDAPTPGSPTTAPSFLVPTPSPLVTPTPLPAGSCFALEESGAMMECSSFGDPHFTTFSGMKHNAMGQGEFVLMQSTGFSVHVCHQPSPSSSTGAAATISTGVAISSEWGVLKFNHASDNSWNRPEGALNSGIAVLPDTPSLGINTITFPSGEVVRAQDAGGVTVVSLPPSYCGNVYGLCGAYNPELNFADTFADSTSDHTPMKWPPPYLDAIGESWGGPYGGEFQRQFVDSWKVGMHEGDVALFTDEECPSGPSYTGEPPVPFAACPELEAAAVEKCPLGERYQACVVDVGLMCDLDTWVGQAALVEAATMQAATMAPSHAPTLSPTDAKPTDTPSHAPSNSPTSTPTATESTPAPSVPTAMPTADAVPSSSPTAVVVEVLSQEPCATAHSCDTDSTVCVINSLSDGTKAVECKCLDGFGLNPLDTESCLSYGSWTATFTIIAAGKRCGNEGYLNVYGTPSVCMHLALGLVDCPSGFFMHAPADGNCKCVSTLNTALYHESEGAIDCADPDNQVTDDEVNLYSISKIDAADAVGAYDLLGENTACGDEKWLPKQSRHDGDTGNALECMHRVLADPDCHSSYFNYSPDDDDCRCARADSYCSDSAAQSEEEGVDLYYIKATKQYQLMAAHTTCSSREWMNQYGDATACMHLTLADEGCNSGFFTHAPADGNCKCADTTTDCTAADNQAVDSDTDLYSIRTKPAMQWVMGDEGESEVSMLGSADEEHSYALMEAGKTCDQYEWGEGGRGGSASDWMGVHGDEAACMHQVLARTSCHSGYFVYAPGNGDCRCVNADTYCDNPANQVEDTAASLYTIKSKTAGYRLMAKQMSCSNTSDWISAGSTVDETMCTQLALANPDCGSDYFVYAPGAGGCKCVAAGTDCTVVANQETDGEHSSTNLFAISALRQTLFEPTTTPTVAPPAPAPQVATDDEFSTAAPTASPTDEPTSLTPTALPTSAPTHGAVVCVEGNTALSDVGDGNTHFLDRHDLSCASTHGILTRMQLSAHGSEMNYLYDCCHVKEAPATCTPFTTELSGDGVGHVNFLNRHDMRCEAGSLLGRVHATRGGTTDQIQYEYSCCTVPGAGGHGACRDATTPLLDDDTGSIVFLGRHNVQCEQGEFLNRVRYRREGVTSKEQYEYTCCQLAFDVVPTAMPTMVLAAAVEAPAPTPAPGSRVAVDSAEQWVRQTNETRAKKESLQLIEDASALHAETDKIAVGLEAAEEEKAKEAQVEHNTLAHTMEKREEEARLAEQAAADAESAEELAAHEAGMAEKAAETLWEKAEDLDGQALVKWQTAETEAEKATAAAKVWAERIGDFGANQKEVDAAVAVTAAHERLTEAMREERLDLDLELVTEPDKRQEEFQAAEAEVPLWRLAHDLAQAAEAKELDWTKGGYDGSGQPESLAQVAAAEAAESAEKTLAAAEYFEKAHKEAENNAVDAQTTADDKVAEAKGLKAEAVLAEANAQIAEAALGICPDGYPYAYGHAHVSSAPGTPDNLHRRRLQDVPPPLPPALARCCRTGADCHGQLNANSNIDKSQRSDCCAGKDVANGDSVECPHAPCMDAETAVTTDPTYDTVDDDEAVPASAQIPPPPPPAPAVVTTDASSGGGHGSSSTTEVADDVIPGVEPVLTVAQAQTAADGAAGDGGGGSKRTILTVAGMVGVVALGAVAVQRVRKGGVRHTFEMEEMNIVPRTVLSPLQHVVAVGDL
jgi:hypothetical protein